MAAPGSRRWLAVGLLGLTAVLARSAAHGQTGKPVEFRHDFRNAKLDERLFRLLGPDAATLVKEEPEGLRLQVPMDQKKPDRVGIKTAFGVQGDFTLTAGFELLEVPRPKAGAGVGFLLYLITDEPKEAGFAFFRIRDVKDGDIYLLSRRIYIPNAKQRYENDPPVEASGESGRLRVTREGAEMVVAAAEGKSDSFRELRRYEFGKTDLKRIELTAYPGRAPNAVVVRVTDFQIRAEALPGLPDSAMAAAEAPPPGIRAALVLGLVLACGAAVAFVALWIRRRKTVRVGREKE